MSVERKIEDIENEIIHMIYVVELWFKICENMELIPWRGNDFLPYWHNLNYSNSIIILEEVLGGGNKKELNLNYYIKRKESEITEEQMPSLEKFKEEINTLSKRVKDNPLYTNDQWKRLSLRSNIAAHKNKNFIHRDFTCGYMSPEIQEKYTAIISDLKKIYCNFTNRTTENPFWKIESQSQKIISKLI